MKVEFRGDDLELADEIESTLQDYADLLGVDLIVSNPHGVPSPPEKAEGKLFIKFWSVPRGTSKAKIGSAFGVQLAEGQCDALKPTGEGLPLIDPITEQVVGEVHEGTLYVLFDLPHAGTGISLMAGIMQCYTALKDPATREKLEKRAAAAKARKELFTVDAHSQYPCDHWKNLARAIRDWVVDQKEIDLPTVLSFSPPKEEGIPTDGKFYLIFEQDSWHMSGARQKEREHLVAHYVTGGLYIRISNLGGCPERGVYKLAEELICELLPLVIERDPKKVAALLDQIREAERKKSREEWARACSKRFEVTVGDTRRKIKAARAAYEEAQREVVEQIRICDGQERKLEQLEATRPQIIERYAAEFDKLFDLPHITAVKVEDNVISVFTDRIYVEQGGSTYDIGNFRIDIYTDGSNGGVRMFNLTRRVNGSKEKMHAPHVFPNGEPCLGNLKEAIPQYIGAYEYSVVAMLAIQYLQSVNVDDMAGKYIDSWPKVQKESKEEIR